ncbi:MAG: hypothetical protein IPK93_03795 [Solirubrobacterales bacterium]|nr:hypothetical protein [Solirubrobacterales bacterium]
MTRPSARSEGEGDLAHVAADDPPPERRRQSPSETSTETGRAVSRFLCGEWRGHEAGSYPDPVAKLTVTTVPIL